MATSSSRFITVAIGTNDIDYRIKTFSTVFWVNCLLAIIVVVFAETLGLWFLLNKMNIPEMRETSAFWVYQCSVLTVTASIISVPYNAAIIANEKMNAFAYITLIAGFAKLIISFVIDNLYIDRLVLYAILLGCVDLIILTSYYLYGRYRLVECRIKRIFDKDFFFEMFKFIGWSSYGSFASAGFTHGINIVLNLFFGPAVNAARAISVQIQNAVISFTSNFQMAINPQLIINTANKDFATARRLLIYSSKLSFFLLCALGLPILSETHFILKIWLVEFPSVAVSFSQIMIVISIFGCLANGLRVVNQAEGDIKRFQVYECSILLLIVPVSYMCLVAYENPIIAFVVHFVLECIAQLVRIYIVLPKIQMRYFYYIRQIYFRMIPVFVVPTLLSYLLINLMEESWLRLFVNVCLDEIAIIGCTLMFGLCQEERKIIINYIRHFKIFKYD